MRNKSFTVWLLFLVHGVFGAGEVSLSLMVGDNVTLLTNDSETQGAEKLMWRIQGETTLIAIIDRETSKTTVPGNDEERFRGRLGVNSTTGSLTITNLKTTDSRVYELQIKTSRETEPNIFNVHVRDVVESVSVMEGDSVTLHTGVTEIQGSDQIVWKFGVIPITNLNGAADGGWSDIHLNEQTRDLTISNIRRNQSGDYKMEINTHSMILHRKLRINSSVTGDGKIISAKEGEQITLHTGVYDIVGYYQILWKTEDVIVAEINKKTNEINRNSERFNGRLHLNEKSGSFYISNSKTKDSGVYLLNMSSDTHTLQRNISVTVSGAPSGMYGAGVGLVVWAVTVFLLQEI